MDSHKLIKLSEIDDFAKETAGAVRGGEILALVGPLGSGKTAFTKALGKHLAIKQGVSSPSFRLLHSHSGKTKNGKKITVYHLDLYRIKGWSEAKALGLEEIWKNKSAVTVIEWANKIKKYLPKNTTFIKFSGT